VSAALLLGLLAVAPTGGGCLAASAEIAEGAVLDTANTAPVACPSKNQSASVRFDRRNGVVRAAAPLAAGDMIGRVYLPARPAILVGDEVVLTAQIGHVSVSRKVRALQPAREGQRLFVVDDGGRIFQAPAVKARSK
jgi:flagella basal body P-ring formation protein FlgA